MLDVQHVYIRADGHAIPPRNQPTALHDERRAYKRRDVKPNMARVGGGAEFSEAFSTSLVRSAGGVGRVRRGVGGGQEVELPPRPSTSCHHLIPASSSVLQLKYDDFRGTTRDIHLPFESAPNSPSPSTPPSAWPRRRTSCVNSRSSSPRPVAVPPPIPSHPSTSQPPSPRPSTRTSPSSQHPSL